MQLSGVALISNKVKDKTPSALCPWRGRSSVMATGILDVLSLHVRVGIK